MYTTVKNVYVGWYITLSLVIEFFGEVIATRSVCEIHTNLYTKINKGRGEGSSIVVKLYLFYFSKFKCTGKYVCLMVHEFVPCVIWCFGDVINIRTVYEIHTNLYIKITIITCRCLQIESQS